MARVVAVFNQKGGVGKTTTSVNLSASLGRMGKKVLLIDCDPQGNASSGVGIDKNKELRNIYTLLMGKSEVLDSIINTAFENLSIIPSNIQLTGAEIELVGYEHREIQLKKVVDSIKHKYDYVIIDCPPSLGILSINALCASDSLLIPIQCEYYALEGLTELVNTFNLIKSRINPKLEIEGVVLTMFDSRTNLAQDVATEVKKHFKDLVYDTKIPRNVKLAEAPSRGLPIAYYDESSQGALAYYSVAGEFIKGGKNG